jgi:hypothetical protein
MGLTLVITAWLASVAPSPVTWDPAPPKHARSVLEAHEGLFSIGPNQLSQGVRHRAKGCVALG